MKTALAKIIEGELVQRDAGYCYTCGGQFKITKREPIYDPVTGKLYAYWIHKKCPNTRWWHMGGAIGKCWPYYRSYRAAPVLEEKMSCPNCLSKNHVICVPKHKGTWTAPKDNDGKPRS